MVTLLINEMQNIEAARVFQGCIGLFEIALK